MVPGPSQHAPNLELHHQQQQIQGQPGLVSTSGQSAKVVATGPPAAVGGVATPSAHTGHQPMSVQLHSIQMNQSSAQGTGIAMSKGGGAISGGGGGLLTTVTPTSMLSNSLGNSVALSSGHMMSHDQSDDSVFSPGIVDDERMKLLERVCEYVLISLTHVYRFLIHCVPVHVCMM